MTTHKLPNQYEQTNLDGYYKTPAGDLYHLQGDYFVAQSGRDLFVCIYSTSDTIRYMDILKMEWVNPDLIQ